MDLGSVRRGEISPGAGDSAESGSLIAIGDAIKHETEVTAPSLTAATVIPNGAGAGASDAAEAMDTTEAEEVENVAKKRKTGVGSRGVANLTPEQLAKKRANGECLPDLFSTPLYSPYMASAFLASILQSIHMISMLRLLGTTQLCWLTVVARPRPFLFIHPSICQSFFLTVSPWH